MTRSASRSSEMAHRAMPNTRSCGAAPSRRRRLTHPVKRSCSSGVSSQLAGTMRCAAGVFRPRCAWGRISSHPSGVMSHRRRPRISRRRKPHRYDRISSKQAISSISGTLCRSGSGGCRYSSAAWYSRRVTACVSTLSSSASTASAVCQCCSIFGRPAWRSSDFRAQPACWRACTEARRCCDSVDHTSCSASSLSRIDSMSSPAQATRASSTSRSPARRGRAMAGWRRSCCCSHATATRAGGGAISAASARAVWRCAGDASGCSAGHAQPSHGCSAANASGTSSSSAALERSASTATAGWVSGSAGAGWAASGCIRRRHARGCRSWLSRAWLATPSTIGHARRCHQARAASMTACSRVGRSGCCSHRAASSSSCVTLRRAGLRAAGRRSSSRETGSGSHRRRCSSPKLPAACSTT